MTHNLDIFKQQAADRALDYIESGMAIGLGTGSTSIHLVQGLAARLRDRRLHDIVGVPTSEATGDLARQLGISIVSLDQHPQLDLAIDGADEIDPALDLIKGAGGALLHEKIVATAAKRLIIIADESKLVAQLGTHMPLPVEVIGFGLAPAAERLTALGCDPKLRRSADGSPFRTDEGNLILDCHFDGIRDAAALNSAIHAIPGVVDHGLFIGIAAIVIVAGAGGIATMLRQRA